MMVHMYIATNIIPAVYINVFIVDQCLHNTNISKLSCLKQLNDSSVLCTYTYKLNQIVNVSLCYHLHTYIYTRAVNHNRSTDQPNSYS